MKILTTFSGRYGDILWSLPTVRAITELKENFSCEEAENNKAKVDFGIMPQYRSLLPLLNAQSYIDKAFVIEDWITTGSPCGDQPWEAPVLMVRHHDVYDKVYHLTYRTHPTKNQPLIDFIASQQGIVLKNPIPFISLRPTWKTIDSVRSEELIDWNKDRGAKNPIISFAFNDSMTELKQKQLDYFKQQLESYGFKFKDVSKLPWMEAAIWINLSVCFIGCRSANYVLACGLDKRVFVYEPNIARSKYGSWGTTFTCPYANESEIVNSQSDVEEIKSLVAGVIQ